MKRVFLTVALSSVGILLWGVTARTEGSSKGWGFPADEV